MSNIHSTIWALCHGDPACGKCRRCAEEARIRAQEFKRLGSTVSTEHLPRIKWICGRDYSQHGWQFGVKWRKLDRVEELRGAYARRFVVRLIWRFDMWVDRK